MKKAGAICVIVLLVLVFSFKNTSALEYENYARDNSLYSAYIKIKPGMTADEIIKLVGFSDNELSGYLKLEHGKRGALFWHWSRSEYEEEVIIPTAFLTIKYIIKNGKRKVCEKKYLYSAEKILIILEEEIRIYARRK